MIKAEKQRERKRNFDDDLEKEKDRQRKTMINNVIQEFQKHLQFYNSHLDAYKIVIEKHRIIRNHVYQLENDLRAIKFDKKKLPYEHNQEVDKLVKDVSSYDIALHELNEKIRAANANRISSVVIAKREMKTFNLQYAKLLSQTARLQASLCTLANQAIRRKIKLPPCILERICEKNKECLCFRAFESRDILPN
ncbi:unnamed protein product [Caenorhabditis bovis]|uniref:Uncharacterized protein n=1 Tax=Caenorhabditis bovis TaxID=2654633 RepID=A0A8S1EJC5_9PELO|nr:unnamed protein product [Caenorhabditis bovis]